ncbi:MAG: hypothetical protein AVDCRST_MAG49-1413, partial [uncultured Thermomicrobiales bacterium]
DCQATGGADGHRRDGRRPTGGPGRVRRRPQGRPRGRGRLAEQAGRARRLRPQLREPPGERRPDADPGGSAPAGGRARGRRRRPRRAAGGRGVPAAGGQQPPHGGARGHGGPRSPAQRSRAGALPLDHAGAAAPARRAGPLHARSDAPGRRHVGIRRL